MSRFSIRGCYPDDGGRVGPDTKLPVERDALGVWRDAGSGSPILARRYAICDDLTGVEIVSAATEAEQQDGLGFAWTFWPDAGECERVGLPVAGAGA